jgi:PilZ domain-containing protein
MSTPNSTPSWSALKRKDLRRSRRYTVDGDTLRVSWLGPNGELKVIQQARVLNISEEGIAFELPDPAQLVTRVKLQSDKHKLLGEGVVRHCRRMGAKYVVGVEFSDGLRWRAPDDAITEPIPLSDPGE